MDIILWSAVLLGVCVQSTFTRDSYVTHDLESFQLCGHGKEEGNVMIKPWGAVILKVGHRLDKDGSQASHSIHNCKVSVSTPEGYGIVAVIEDMKLQGKRNSDNGWDCEDDYVKLSTVSSSTIAKVLDKLLPGDLFKKKATEELCGIRLAESRRFSEVGTSANVFHTLSNSIEVDFHQGQKNRNIVNNSFTIVVTTFMPKGSDDRCDGQYTCPGNNNYCINSAYVCDGHANCAFSSGGDETNCQDDSVSQQPMFTATTTIIMTLGCIVGLGLVVCCLFTIIMRAKSRNTTRAGTPVRTSVCLHDATAPPLDRQHTLPGYEAVVMSDIEGENKESVPPTPAVGEYPPAYDQLFPDGPPKVLGNENSK
ncbi:uncharacterized protein [Palaemon carinicauda]|uniref:uncharacterized protein isoform X2 n=1 Tax=Palaemon carinicauda TaxID=392227 RepID=UPI0035B59D4A